MASPAAFLLVGLLVACGATAASEEIPHLDELSLTGATTDWVSGPALHGSNAPPTLPFMSIMKASGCGSFAALVAATPDASAAFEERLAAGGGGLTVFCPDDKAVAGFGPTFQALADDNRLAVLLHHGAAGRYVRSQLAGFNWVSVPTLAATGETQTVLVRERNGTMRLWPTWPEDSVATVTKTVDDSSSSEAPLLVLHVIDAVLLRKEQLDDGAGGDGTAACGGGYLLSWLHPCIPLWVLLFWLACFVLGYVTCGWRESFGAKDVAIKY